MLPSKRYHHLVLEGARAAGLNADYIAELEKHAVYEPSAETLEARRKLLAIAPESLPQVSVAEFAREAAAAKECDPPGSAARRVAVCGYVFEIPASKGDMGFDLHIGRDTTTRFVLQLIGISLDENDDHGRAPFPVFEKQLSAAEQEYVLCWLDHYYEKSGRAHPVAFVKEYAETQRRGQSEWQHPRSE
uniref:Uncharacterized protein n=1 Tax=Erythrolobus australicus TaxID=1077150 RepID=A0A7S1XH00_9RHOD